MRLTLAALVAVPLALAQEVLLPRAVARRLERELGPGSSVRVRARPAFKLLAGRADRVELRVEELQVSRAAGRLRGLRGARLVDARAARVALGPLRAHDAVLRQEGGTVELGVTLGAEPLVAFGLSLTPVAGGADGLVLEGRAAMFTARARLRVRDGAVVLAPEGPLAALPAVPLLADPALRVERLHATRIAAGWRVTVEATASRPSAGDRALPAARRWPPAPARGSPGRAA